MATRWEHAPAPPPSIRRPCAGSTPDRREGPISGAPGRPGSGGARWSQVMTVRRIGGWRDSVRRLRDAAVASLRPGGLPIAPILAQVDGYLLPHEGVFLYWLARSAPGSGCIVEIGSFRGRSTLCMAAGVRGRRKSRLFAVDPHVYRTAGEL